jgi:predicted peptidase
MNKFLRVIGFALLVGLFGAAFSISWNLWVAPRVGLLPPAASKGPSPVINVPAIQPGLAFRRVEGGGRGLDYAVYVPRDADVSKPMPLVVFLHGRMESGTDGVKQTSVGLLPAMLNKPEEWPFVVLMPQKPEQAMTWESQKDLVLAMIDRECAERKIDLDRIYLTGLSQGGAGTWAIAAAFPERFAAIAPVCGFGETAGVGEKLANMPIWAFHGEKDDVIPFAQSVALVDTVKAARGKLPADGKAAATVVPEPKLTLYPDAKHNSWDNAYRSEKLGAWLLSWTRGGKPAAK